MIVASAIKHKGVVYTGLRHASIIRYMVHGLGIVPPISTRSQGFITDENVFLLRDAAYTHAKECGQLTKPLLGSVLTSEDLWPENIQMRVESDEHTDCNHHHEIIQGEQEVVDFGNGKFVADMERIPLIRELNRAGLTTRSHCYGHENPYSFVAILMDNIENLEVRSVTENHSTREFNDKQELVISWRRID